MRLLEENFAAFRGRPYILDADFLRWSAHPPALDKAGAKGGWGLMQPWGENDPYPNQNLAPHLVPRRPFP